jgi:hypothetical protein
MGGNILGFYEVVRGVKGKGYTLEHPKKIKKIAKKKFVQLGLS